MPASPVPAPLWAFGPFVLDRTQQRLLRDGQVLNLGPRPYAVLVELVAHAGQSVSKDELLDAVWGHRHLSESVLKGCINTLRAVLGDASKAPLWIETLPRRGYRFIGTVRAREADAVDEPRPAAPLQGNLPAALGPLTGREADLRELRVLLAEHRLLTLVGAGGIGKTRLALALARAPRAPHTPHAQPANGTWLVRLDALADGEALVGSIAAALQLSADAARSADSLARTLATLSLLLVLDNCEHLLGAVSPLVSQLLEAAPDLRVLATSQEPLHVQGEQLWRVQPLSWPDPQQVPLPPLAELERFGAVALLLQAVRTRVPGFVLDDESARHAVTLSARLDGLPLALELAAARVPLLGLAGVVARLDERLQLLTSGGRDVPPRHRTLRATLAWSHALLTVEEQRLLHRLGVFAGSFSLEAVQAVAADAPLSPWQVMDGLGALLEKSLIVAVADDVIAGRGDAAAPQRVAGGERDDGRDGALSDGALSDGDGTAARTAVAAPSQRLRLFDSIRSFALEQLAAEGEAAATHTRHMHWMRATLDAALQAAHDTPALAWVARLRPELDNLRVALRHALQHDAECALALATQAALLWQRAGLRHEAMRWLDAVRPLLTDATPPALRAGFAQALGLLHVYGLQGLPADAEAALQEAAQAHHELGDALNEYFDLYLLVNTQLRVTPDADPLPLARRMKALEAPDWGVLRTRYRRQVEGMWLRDSGDAPGYRRFCIEELERMRSLGDLHSAWGWSYGLALAEHDAGHAERAIALLSQTLEELRAAGLLRTHTHVAAMLASMRLEQGQLPACLEQAREALSLLRVDGALWWMAGALAYGAYWLGREDDAARLLGWADAMVARRGVKPGLFFARLRAGCEARLRLKLVNERLSALLEEGAMLDDASALRLALG